MIAKLKLVIFKDAEFKDQAHEINLQINPADYKLNKSISYEAKGLLAPQYKQHGQDNLSLDFVIDGTGVVPADEEVIVSKKVEEMEKFLYEPFLKEDTAQPYFVQVRWGKMFFNGRLEKMQVHYTLFKPNGEPLRAKVSLSFVRSQPPEITAKFAASQATKERLIEVKSGETLPFLCSREYGDSTMDVTVAKKNGLPNIRTIKPGQKLLFPAL